MNSSITTNQIKLIKSLQQKKYRTQHGLFVVEGIKGIQEFLRSDFELYQLLTTEPVFSEASTTVISQKELQKVSGLKSPNVALAVFKIPKQQDINTEGLILALDDVRDPGNLGTIIRLCDWFGIKHLVCSMATVDCYNPKVVQATMGSLTRVQLSYLQLETFMTSYPYDSFGTFMDGHSIYTENLPKNGLIVMGNEANGISENIAQMVTRKISIPRFGAVQATESLNVATATAIVLNEFRRTP